MNLPNCLSIVRILLIPVFLIVYLTAKEQPAFYLAAGILLLSALTDMLDGYIARRYQMITQLGKILDPVADKLTQAAVSVALLIRFPQLWMIPALFLFKELLFLIGGLKLWKKRHEIGGARWFGKLYTVVFYLVMLLIVSHPRMPAHLLFWMLSVIAVFTLFALVMYIPVFLRAYRDGVRPKNPSAGNREAQ